MLFFGAGFRRRLKDLVWLRICFDLSVLGTCKRRQVGAVFLDIKGRVVATGYNGNAPGSAHCIDHPCRGASAPSGTGLELCEAIHAEQNALAHCHNIDLINTVYSTDSPCMHCVKMLATTPAARIVFAREYPHPASRLYWEGLGRVWEHIPEAQPEKSLYEALQMPRYAVYRLMAGVSLVSAVVTGLVALYVR